MNYPKYTTAILIFFGSLPAVAAPPTATVTTRPQGQGVTLKLQRPQQALWEGRCRRKLSTFYGAQFLCNTAEVAVRFAENHMDASALLQWRPQDGSGGNEIWGCRLVLVSPSDPSGRSRQSAEYVCEQRGPNPDRVSGLSSPFLSEVPTLPIPNASVVASDSVAGPVIFRGMEPRTPRMIDGLRATGIKHVLIFKTQTDLEVDHEIAALRGNPDDPTNVPIDATYVPFPYKEFESFSTACRQTVAALSVLATRFRAKEKTYFHCTVGEDRTGYLSGLFKLLLEGGTAENIFARELCERGYEAGNAQKPFAPVVVPIQKELTAIYWFMAKKILSGELRLDRLDGDEVCREEIDLPAATADDHLRCISSSRFNP